MPINFNFTVDMLQQIMLTNKQVDDWFVAISNNLPKYDIDTMLRCASFLSQTCHESLEYTHLHENLNYKAASLIAVWPTHFNASNASQYAHHPEKIANRAYANRMGNGDEDSGDGWKYRGRGPIQITGKNNYEALSNALYGDTRLLDTPDLLETDMDISVCSACWFWDTHNLNQYADNSDIEGMTKRINGGLNGLSDRIERYNNALTILQG